MNNIEIESLGGFKRGQRVEAQSAYSRVWRPAYISRFTPKTYNHEEGCYLYWRDVDPNNSLQSSGGWCPLRWVRDEVPAEVIS